MLRKSMMKIRLVRRIFQRQEKVVTPDEPKTETGFRSASIGAQVGCLRCEKAVATKV